MTPKTVRRVQNLWTDTVVVASLTTHRYDTRLSVPEHRPAPTPMPSAEEESDRWVAQALVECYNA
jgi:hypothetical protein